MASAATASSERLLTIEEFEQLSANGQRSELVRGRIVALNPPFPWHGYVCGKVDRIVGGYGESQDLGYPMTNDSGVVTERNPDTLRGADFAFYSYKKVPKGSLVERGYLAVAPDLVIEVRSPDDVWKDIVAKVEEYLNAGVGVVCVLDPERRTATIYEPNQPEVTLQANLELTFPNVLPGFSVQVSRFFE